MSNHGVRTAERTEDEENGVGKPTKEGESPVNGSQRGAERSPEYGGTRGIQSEGSQTTAKG